MDVPAGQVHRDASEWLHLLHAPVAQLDRVSASEAEGRQFESGRAHHFHEGLWKSIEGWLGCCSYARSSFNRRVAPHPRPLGEAAQPPLGASTLRPGAVQCVDRTALRPGEGLR